MRLHHACGDCFVRTYVRAEPRVVYSAPTDPSGTCAACGLVGVPGFRVDDYSIELVREARERSLRR